MNRRIHLESRKEKTPSATYNFTKPTIGEQILVPLNLLEKIKEDMFSCTAAKATLSKLTSVKLGLHLLLSYSTFPMK
jgi:hypothetical protein